VNIAISGLSIQVQGCQDLQAFRDLLLCGRTIPACQQTDCDPRQSLGNVCLAALHDADCFRDDQQNTAFLLVNAEEETDPLLFDLAGSVDYLPGGHSWLFSVWQRAKRLLSEGLVDTIVAAATETEGHGAVAVVFQRMEDVQQKNSRVYAVIDEEQALRAACSLELGMQAKAPLAQLDPAQFVSFTRNDQCALGTITETIGCEGEFADLAGLIKASLSLYHRTHYAIPHWQGPSTPEHWEAAPFYVPTDSQPWFLEAGTNRRQAVLVCADSSGKLKGLPLAEEPQLRFPAQAAFSSTGMHLLPLQANSPSNLMDMLNQLSTRLTMGESLPELAHQYLTDFTNTESQSYALGLVGSSMDELRSEIEHAQRGIGRAIETGKNWQSPTGSAFSPQPLGPQAKVAFVYPGGFNSYVGMARNVFALFPRLHDRLAELTNNIALSLQSEILYPHSISPLTDGQIAELNAQLSKDPIAMITTGTAVAFLYSTILQEVFGLSPASAFGYSLGENSMMFALGVWEAADEARCNFNASPLFHSRLAGPTLAAREHWGVRPQETGVSQTPLWGNFVLMAKPRQVQDALANEERVYLTHINAPRQVVIGGEVQACKRVIASLKCMHLQAPYDYALHCKAMSSEYSRLEELHTLPVENIPQSVLYTAADYHPTILDTTLIAENIATALTNRLDFPRLVERVYEDGARIFIEVGAGSNCSKWIGSILKGKPHTTTWVDQAKVDEQTMFVRLLAKLVSQRVPLNLAALQQPESAVFLQQLAV